MSNIVFEDFSLHVKEAIEEKAIGFLNEVGGEIRSLTQRNSRRDTSQTAGSYQYKVDEQNNAVHIGSDYENAIWEEFGTGIHAINGDGRKTPWFYKDRNGVGHKTRGKTANRPLYRAYEASKNRIIKRAEEVFGGLNNDK